MAHFRGTVRSPGRQEANRLAHKTGGLTMLAQGWEGGVVVEADHEDGKDVFRVYMTRGTNGPAEGRVYLCSVVSYPGDEPYYIQA